MASLEVRPAASVTVYVIVVVPLLKVYVPTWLTPVEGEEAVVAPVITQVSLLIVVQLSLVPASVIATEAEHALGSLLTFTSFAAVTTGAVASFEVSVRVQVVKLPEGSVTVKVTT
jgi:hypothetical protein